MAYAPRNDRAGGGSRGGFGGGFNKGGGSKFGGAPRGRGGFGGGFDKPELFPAVCADCGNRCEVPFKPNGRKPVLCRDCFAQENGSEPRFGNDRGGDRPERAPRASAPAAMSEDLAAQIRSIQGKLDMIIKSLNANDLGL